MSLNRTQIKIFLNAYYVRLRKGESLESIDKSFIENKKLTREEADYIHTLIEE